MAKKRKPPIKTAYGKNPSPHWKTRPEKQPSSEQDKPVWRLSLLDWDGPWGWRNIDAKKWQEILQKLGHFETRTWADIKNDGNNHAVEIQNSPNPEVPKRLIDIHLDDIDELFSLRLSGKERVWGILEGHILKILWWDPNHEVWPSTKKHT
ncbi:hypothetical protein THIOM_003223 [Candidatus Thiomargarita nelsonii]|uniref:Uncharacterized protein n=1 Tax=Candidatus Thiomargarita nelsonii TaxID=1003181 RepID=A0A176RZB0_9GAMM|nr:hypothetical protein THIOM_003223 [Candidatus Thiomargarita nelsonii]